MIRVMYKNGIQDTAGFDYLDYLLEKDMISKFMRSDGWATLGRDPIRSTKNSGTYEGPERRASQK